MPAHAQSADQRALAVKYIHMAGPARLVSPRHSAALLSVSVLVLMFGFCQLWNSQTLNLAKIDENSDEKCPLHPLCSYTIENIY